MFFSYDASNTGYLKYEMMKIEKSFRRAERTPVLASVQLKAVPSSGPDHFTCDREEAASCCFLK